MALAEERQHMMLAHAVKFNVPDDDHIVRFRFEQSTVDHGGKIFTVTAHQIFKTFADPFRRIQQSFPFRVFADRLQNLPHCIFHHT